jgi:hypothetical protein
MYQKPALQLYGDLRALTLLGAGADGDLSGTFLAGTSPDGACGGGGAGVEDALGLCRS